MLKFDDIKVVKKIELKKNIYELYDLTIGIIRDSENKKPISYMRVIKECSNIPSDVVEKIRESEARRIVEEIYKLSGGEDTDSKKK